jgi:IS4 transposase
LPDKQQGVHLDQLIELTYKEAKQVKTLTLRMVKYVDEKGRKYEFLSNCITELTAEEIAASYKKRWDIELLFKKLKQNFQLHYFYGENETAIRTQIWCTLIAQLLISVIQNRMRHKKHFQPLPALLESI